MIGCCLLSNNGLGLVASGKRNIRSGAAYDRYFDNSKLHRRDKVVLYGTNFDTLDKMKDIVRKTLNDTKRISAVLKNGTIEGTARNIWNFLYDHIQYVKDNPNFEELRRPLRTWADRKGDCDCYSIFASSVLANLGISHAFRMAAYKGDYQHVYVVVPETKGANLDDRSNYYVIDPVTDQYNFEVPYSKKYDKPMNMPIKYLDGIGDIALTSSKINTIERPIHIPFGLEFDNVGVNGLGQLIGDELAIARDFLHRTKLHLVNTLKAIRQNPESVVPMVGDPQEFIREIEMALAAWDNPIERDKVLAHLAAKENQMNGLNGFFKKIWGGIKDGVSKVGQAVSNAAKWTGDKVASGAKAVANAAKAAGKAIIRYNPLSLAIRGGLQGAMSKNLFNMALKLGYGYYTDEQAKSVGIDINRLKEYREKLDRVKKIWKGLQGKEDKLRSAIMEGHNHGAGKRNLPNVNRGIIYKNPLNGGFGEPVTIATTGAASGVIATITAFLKNLDVKDLFKKGVEKAKEIAQAKLHQTIENKLSPNTPGYPVPSASQYPLNTQSMLPDASVPPRTVIPQNVQANAGGSNGPLLLIGGLGIAAAAYLFGGSGAKKSTKNTGLSGVSRKSKEAPEMVIC